MGTLLCMTIEFEGAMFKTFFAGWIFTHELSVPNFPLKLLLAIVVAFMLFVLLMLLHELSPWVAACGGMFGLAVSAMLRLDELPLKEQGEDFSPFTAGPLLRLLNWIAIPLDVALLLFLALAVIGIMLGQDSPQNQRDWEPCERLLAHVKLP